MVIKTEDMTLNGTIACKDGKVFMITTEPFDIDFKKDVEYYLKQGCKVEITIHGKYTFSKCECAHCQSLTHLSD